MQQISMFPSKDTTVATVDFYGNVLGVSEGSATITVTTDDGAKTATCIVNVAAPKYTIVNIGNKDDGVTYTGTGFYYSVPRAINDDVYYMLGDAICTATYTFTGTGIDVVGNNDIHPIGNEYLITVTTILEGITGKLEAGCQIQYKPGILLDRTNTNPIDWTTPDAKATNASIVVMGISGLIEGEEGEAIASEHFGDRLDYNIPPNQIEFLKKMRKDNSKPIIAVITGGSPMNLSEIYELADAVLLVWYPGEEGGKAVANVLFGDVSPSGKLPVTFPKSLDQLPPYEDYSMVGRTYRYMSAEPMFPFGFGLSYTTFKFEMPIISNTIKKDKREVEISVDVTNIGNVKSDEVIQLYITTPASEGLKLPLYSFKGFKRLTLASGEKQTVKFKLNTKLLESINNNGESVLIPGTYTVNIGESSPGSRSEQLGSAKESVCKFQITK